MYLTRALIWSAVRRLPNPGIPSPPLTILLWSWSSDFVTERPSRRFGTLSFSPSIVTSPPAPSGLWHLAQVFEKVAFACSIGSAGVAFAATVGEAAGAALFVAGAAAFDCLVSLDELQATAKSAAAETTSASLSVRAETCFIINSSTV